MRILVFLLGMVSISAQTQPPRPATNNTKGNCSVANSGAITTVNINCSELSLEQASVLQKKIPDLLNLILQVQKSDSSQIIKHVDACVDAVGRIEAANAPRSLTVQQFTVMRNLLIKGSGSTVAIECLHMGKKEAADYANTISNVFASAQWKIEPVISLDGSFGVNGMLLDTGLHLLGDPQSSQTKLVIEAFKAIGVDLFPEGGPLYIADPPLPNARGASPFHFTSPAIVIGLRN